MIPCQEITQEDLSPCSCIFGMLAFCKCSGRGAFQSCGGEERYSHTSLPLAPAKRCSLRAFSFSRRLSWKGNSRMIWLELGSNRMEQTIRVGTREGAHQCCHGFGFSELNAVLVIPFPGSTVFFIPMHIPLVVPGFPCWDIMNAKRRWSATTEKKLQGVERCWVKQQTYIYTQWTHLNTHHKAAAGKKEESMSFSGKLSATLHG